MRSNETGEFELVVGDRQLLSAFFIVVLLCAVAFAMGYVVGQNAPHSGKPTAEATSTPPPSSSGDPRPQPLPPAPQTAAAAAENPAPKTEGAPQPTTQPAQGAEEPKPQPPAPAETAAASASSNGLVAAEDLPTGNFWQVMAGAQPQAEMMRTTLRGAGFSVVLSPAPKGL